MFKLSLSFYLALFHYDALIALWCVCVHVSECTCVCVRHTCVPNIIVGHARINKYRVQRRKCVCVRVCIYGTGGFVCNGTMK